MLIEANRAARRKIPVNGQIIHPMAVSVLMELDERYNMQEGVSRPSRKYIAAQLGVTDVAAISRAMTELVKAGFIVREQRGRKSVYRFRGPLFEHHLEVKPARQTDTDDMTESVTGDTSVTEITDTHDIPRVPMGVTEITSPVTPVTPPNKNPVKEPGNGVEPVSSPPTSTKSPGPESPPAKRNKVKELFDRCDELGVKRPNIRPQDARSLKTHPAEPRLVAEAWEAAWNQRWRDDWVQKTMTIQVILNKIDLYELWLERGNARPQQRQGASNLGPSAKDAATPGFYDDLLDPKFRGLGAVLNDIEYLKKLFQEKHGHDVRTPCPTPCYTPPADYYQGGKS